MKESIFIRVDGSASIGLGHLVRCIALAQMLNDDFAIHFFCIEIPDQLIKEIIQLNFGFTRIIKEELFIDALKGDEIVVLDNYFFDTGYQLKIKIKGCKLVCIDDIADRYFAADAVINHGGGITTSDYSATPYTLLLLGPQYRLLRKDFFEFKGSKKKVKRNRNLFICLGGADSQNITLEILKSLDESIEFEKVFCLIGSVNKNEGSLNDFAKNSSLNIQLLKSLDVTGVIKYMSVSDTAITAASTIAYEYLSIGGTLYIIKTADNQSKLYDYLLDNEMAQDYCTLNKHQSFAKGKNIDAIFSKSSPIRIKRIFKLISLSKQLSLRRVHSDDLMQVYSWINDPNVRSQSFNENHISLEDHSDWFAKAINRNSVYYYILEQRQQPLGQIRFEKENDQLILNYLLAPEARGKGLGAILVQMGVEKVLADINEKINISAYVKINNKASNEVFKKLPFKHKLSSKFPDSNMYYYSFIENERI